MSENLGQAILELSTDDSGLDKGLAGAEKKTSGWAKRVGGVLKGALVIGAGLAAGAMAGLGAVLASSTKDAMAAEEVQAQLNAVLKSTKGAAGVSQKAVNKYADSLSKVTRFDDEAIVSGESLLLTFTNIGEKVFPQATEVMLDMSQALGQDLKSSALQLGKALNDPVQGMTALRRVGVQFTDDQVAQVKALQESGDLMGAQAIILAELEREFGGAAKAAGQTFGGQLDILHTALGNVKERIGGALIPMLTDLAIKFGPELVAGAEKFADWAVGTLVPALGNVATWLAENIPNAFGTLAGFWKKTLQPAFSEMWTWLALNIPAAITTLESYYNANLKGTVESLWKSLADPTTGLIPAFKLIADYLKIDLPSGFQKTGEDMGIAGGKADDFKLKMFNLVEEVKKVLRVMEDLATILNRAYDWVTALGVKLHGVIEEWKGWNPIKSWGMFGNNAPALPNTGSNLLGVQSIGGLAGAGAAAGNNSWNITVNASGGDPLQIERATRNGVLSAARAAGLR